MFQASGIAGFLFHMTPELTGSPSAIADFFNCETLVISIPPGASKNGSAYHPLQIKSIIEKIKGSPIKEIIYISATSVYPDLNRIVVEDDVSYPQESNASALVEAENLLKGLRDDQRSVTILRLGGLLGYNRIPGKYVRGQKELTTGAIPVNYIHRDDAVGIITEVIRNGVVNETFNVVCPIHTTRREVYEKSCVQFGWEVPTFSEPASPANFKVISADKLTSFYPYDFIYADPLDFFYEE